MFGGNQSLLCFLVREDTDRMKGSPNFQTIFYRETMSVS